MIGFIIHWVGFNEENEDLSRSIMMADFSSICKWTFGLLEGGMKDLGGGRYNQSPIYSFM